MKTVLQNRQQGTGNAHVSPHYVTFDLCQIVKKSGKQNYSNVG